MSAQLIKKDRREGGPHDGEARDQPGSPGYPVTCRTDDGAARPAGGGRGGPYFFASTNTSSPTATSRKIASSTHGNSGFCAGLLTELAAEFFPGSPEADWLLSGTCGWELIPGLECADIACIGGGVGRIPSSGLGNWPVVGEFAVMSLFGPVLLGGVLFVGVR